MLQVACSSYTSLSEEPGVYLFKDAQGAILYVGKAKNLKKRVSSYFTNQSQLGDKTRQLVAKIKIISYIVVTSEIESLLLEANYIKKHKPFFNIRFTDGKAYPIIRITKKETYPKLLVARRMDDKESIYFGPYPNVSAMKLVLKTVRRIFPYESAKHYKRFCLYHHLGLCPCAEVVGTEAARKEYKKTIQHIIHFLEGNVTEFVKELEKERDNASKQEDFENASRIQRKIDAIKLVTTQYHQPFEYEENPNLRIDIRRKELNDLQEHLAKKRVFTEEIHRIECYDISNTQGTNATGSLVVFTDGEKDASQYRQFKISSENKGPNDFAMMHEVLSRRFKHTEWRMPDLVVVDGGKGQVSLAGKALNDLGISVPLVGLAKREEIIVTRAFEEIRLPKDSKALQLIMRLRDEAHRFALTYHKKLRSKAIFS